MKIIFIITIAIIVFALIIPSIVYMLLSWKALDEVPLQSFDNYNCIDTSHKSYEKYIKYKKFSEKTYVLSWVFLIPLLIIVIIARIMGWL